MLYYSSLKGFLHYSSPTKDALLFLSQRISLLFQSDKGSFAIPLSKDFFTIPVRQRTLDYSSLKGFLYYSSPTKDSWLLLSQRISSLFQPDKGLLTIPLSKDFFTIPVRRRMLYYSSLKGFLHYSSPTKDSWLLLSQRISLLFQSDKGLLTTPLSKDFFSIPARQRITY